MGASSVSRESSSCPKTFDEVSPKAALFEDTPMEVSDGKVSDGKADVRRESLKREDSLLAPTGETLKSISLALVKSLILLFCVTSFAASVFSHAEMPKEMRAARKARVTLRRIQQKYNMSDADVRDLADAQISKPRCGRCSRGDVDSVCRKKRKHCNWNWVSSFYFSMTVFTTIGYGTFAPATSLGKGLVVVFFFPGVIVLGYFVVAVGVDARC